MSPDVKLFLLSGLVPCGIAACLGWLGLRCLPTFLGHRYPIPIALAVAFFVGCWLAPGLIPFWPARNWHWLIHIVVMAAVIGPLANAAGLSAVERWLLIGATCALAAVVLSPNLADPPFSRLALVAVGTAYTLVLIVLLEPLSGRLPGKLFPWALVGTTLACAGMIAWTRSMRFGQIGGVFTAGLVGCAVVSTFSTVPPLATRSVIPVWAVFTAGLTLVGYLGSGLQGWGALLLPAAPLALWSCIVGPLSRLRGVWAAVAQVAVVLAVVALGVGLLMWEETHVE